MSARPLADAAARGAAVTTFDRNVVVVAGAGTGKTSLLVERLLVAVGLDRVRLREVAAVTFTEKAAGEMRERLAEGLERLARLAGSPSPPDTRHAADRAFERLVGRGGTAPVAVGERTARALEDLEGTTITTVHGFCAEILRAFPLEAELPPGFEVDTGERAEALFEEEWAAFLAEELGPEAERAELWESVLERIPLSSVAAVAREFARDAIPADVLANRGGAGAATEALARIAGALAAEIERLLVEAPNLHASPRAFYEAAVRTLRAVARDGAAAVARIDPALDRKDAPRAAKSAPPGIAEELEEAGKRAHRLIGRLGEVDETLWTDLFDVVRKFVGSMRDALAARGLVGFDALLVRARDLLRDRPDVRERLKSRWRMILLDEFQDTDPLQYEIVLFLAERAGESSRDPFRANLEPGRLFVVGDPKQSIYRFRGADYGAFVRALETIRGEHPALDLTANFRSRPALLEAVNELFAPPGSAIWRASTEDDPFPVQPPYVAVTAGLEEDGGDAPAVEVLTVDAGEGANAHARRVAEGEVLAAEILRLRGSARDFAFRDVLVLLRTFSNVALYARALRQAGIPFVVDGGKSFFERAEVTQLLAVLRALAVPADPVALLAYLRSPAGGVDDAELDRWAAASGRWSREETPDPAGFPRLSRALMRIRAWAEEIQDLPADRAIALVLDRSGLVPLGAFAYEGAQRVANLRKLAGAAIDLSRDGSLTFAQVLDAVAGRKGSDVESESPLADERTEAVRLLTIHKAKGLESRFVFVGDLARGESAPPSSEDVVLEACTFPRGRALAASSRAAGIRNAASIAAEIEGRHHDEAERTRLLYVAATRARERLVLVAAPVAEGKEPPWLAALGAWGYRPSAPPQDGSRIGGGRVRHRAPSVEAPEPLPAATPERLPDPGAFAAAVERACAAAERGRFLRASDRSDRDEEDGEGHAGTLERSIALAVGSVVHRLLERFSDGGGAGLVARVEAEAREEARRRGMDAEAVAREAGAIVRRFEEGPLAPRFSALRVVAREMPLLWRDEEGLFKGVVDFVYRDGDGTIAVADWKTDADADEALERYAAQIRRYARALRTALALERDPRGELWMVRTGEVLEVPREEERS